MLNGEVVSCQMFLAGVYAPPLTSPPLYRTKSDTFNGVYQKIQEPEIENVELKEFEAVENASLTLKHIGKSLNSTSSYDSLQDLLKMPTVLGQILADSNSNQQTTKAVTPYPGKLPLL